MGETVFTALKYFFISVKGQGQTVSELISRTLLINILFCHYWVQKVECLSWN